MEEYKEKGKCIICGGTYYHWGNNAEPIKNGRCCDLCNDIKVIPARLNPILSPTHMKQTLMMRRRNSPAELMEIYSWIRENVFPERYLVPAKKIIFEWSNEARVDGRCSKNEKAIVIAKRLLKDTHRLYEVMLHEMLHLRMNHHRKSFYAKQKALKAKLESYYWKK